jgi:hypothetical protein
MATVLGEIDDMPDDERRFLLRLITEAREIAQEIRMFCRAEARRITMQLGGALLLAAGREQQKNPTRATRVATTRDRQRPSSR